MRLAFEEILLAFRSKKFLIFVAVMIAPVIVIALVFGIALVPEQIRNGEIILFIQGEELGREQILESMIDSLKEFGNFARFFWVGLPIIAITSILTSEYIAGEYSQRTLHTFVSKPIYRSEFVLMKFLSFVVVSFVLFSFVYCSILLCTSIVPAHFGLLSDWVASEEIWNTSFAWIWISELFILAIASMSLLFSSITKRAILAGILPIFFFFGMNLVTSIFGFYEYAYYDVLYSTGIIWTVEVFGENALEGTVHIDPTIGVVTLVLFIILPLLFSIIILERKDLE